jgi:hypothetical protein
MQRFTFGDNIPAQPADKAAEILKATKSSLLKIAVIMVVLVWAAKYYLV